MATLMLKKRSPSLILYHGWDCIYYWEHISSVTNLHGSKLMKSQVWIFRDITAVLIRDRSWITLKYRRSVVLNFRARLALSPIYSHNHAHEEKAMQNNPLNIKITNPNAPCRNAHDLLSCIGFFFWSDFIVWQGIKSEFMWSDCHQSNVVLFSLQNKSAVLL